MACGDRRELIADSTRTKLRSAALAQWADPQARMRILRGQRVAAERRWRRSLVEENLGLATWMAAKHEWTGLDFDDLRQAALLGLMKAAQKFDRNRGAQFSTLAWWWMRSAIQQEYVRNRATIRVPAHRSTGDGPRVVSTAAPVGSAELGDLLTDRDGERPDIAADAAFLRDDVREALSTLRPRDTQVVEMRFGINGAGRPHTLEEIASEMGVTRERVRQIKGRAMERLRFRLRDA